ncbi:HesA/MoeB/ThiF family protein [Paracoccus saliphilus]|uniref:Molybdopterin-synthase adenylyltransferase n=1 Tax=Paracoccus saliphilus TaxID=405559 RepID=A0AA46A534_9RHOB|nr:HesA/MoeB/ThiF family protein [Paracoccus saliphilus]WCR04873.1 HesA/MoeB/ThiF family protein [Paracoccus saliphilus]SIS73278.1 Molybdopterin or thiamine biosynthesis adenylyltransferase [Paracoccus saliphilus]
MLGLSLIAGLTALALVFRLPGRIALLMAGGAWLAIVLLLGLAPESGMAQSIGGTLNGWLFGGGLAALVLAYRVGLRRLRALAPEADTGISPADDGQMSDAELDRYARHLVLREIGGPGQMRLRDARVLVVGAGGLGAPICLYLAAAGVGRITLADDDTVSLSNLQRQVIFRSGQRGEMKADAAAGNMAELNPHIEVTPLHRRITGADADLVARHDLVIDGTDSFASRDEVNRACVTAGVPLIAGAIAQWEGQVTLYHPAQGGPCMACLFPEAPAPGLAPACAEAGVVGALPGVVGSIMALEAIKHLTGAGEGLRGRMLIFDGLYGETRMISITQREDCPVCRGHRHA